MPNPKSLLAATSLGLSATLVAPVSTHATDIFPKNACYTTSLPLLVFLNLSSRFHGHLSTDQNVYSVHGFWTDRNEDGSSQDTVTVHGTQVIDPDVGSLLGLDVMFVRGDQSFGGTPSFTPVQFDCYSEEAVQLAETWTCQAVQDNAASRSGAYFGSFTLERTDDPLCEQFVIGPGDAP